ncbi:MAG: hypothetical protein ACR2KG_11440 [Nocardioidaceae bacterium]
MLHAHCRDIGREPGEIMLSSHVRLSDPQDPAAAAHVAAALGEAGADLAIIQLPVPHDAAVSAPLADALAPLRG